MKKALFLMTIAGAGLGLMLPSGRSTAPASPVPAGAAGEVLLERQSNGHFYANAEVNGELVRVLVDTGATSVALTMRDAERLGIPFSASRFTVIGSGASGPVRGEQVMIDSVSVEGKEVRTVQGAVVEGLDVSLLGQAYLSRLGSVEMSKDQMRLQ